MQGFSRTQTTQTGTSLEAVESPLARGVAALAYLSDFFGVPFLVPFAVWTIFPRSRFLRAHALYAGIFHLSDFALSAVFQTANYLFISESENGMSSLREAIGQVFVQLPALTGTVLISESLGFVVLLGILDAADMIRCRRRPFGMVVRTALIAALGVPLLLYSPLLWSNTGTESIIDWNRFREPTVLFPGHVTLLFCAWGALWAGAGRRLHFSGLSGLFVLLQRSHRSRGEKRERPAVVRAISFPGWGHFFLGRRVSGLSLAGVFLVALLFTVVSFGLVYGTWAEAHKGLNANFAWYFLSDLGLRSAIRDAELKNILGRPVSLIVLLISLAAIFLFSWWSARLLARSSGRRFREFLATVPQSLLAHLFIVSIFLLVPINFLVSSSSGKPAPKNPIQVIPDHFEPPQKKLQLDGGVVSGNDKLTQDPAGGTQSPRDGHQLEGQGGGKGKGSEFGRPGKRQDMTYSNYISARIRGPEKWLGYWGQMPKPYSAVFEYKISSTGEVYDIAIREPSRYPDADQLTVRMIEAMGRLLPPPAGRTLIVTELFWNTTPGDDSLPTQLQRDLSNVFDGRHVREPY